MIFNLRTLPLALVALLGSEPMPGSALSKAIAATGPLILRVMSPETIAGRAAFLARANPKEPPPRIVVNIPIVIR